MPLDRLLSSHFSLQLTVQREDIDLHQHVNNKVYLKWMEDIAWQHSLAVGIDETFHQKIGKILLVKSHQLNYLLPAKEGDQLEMQTWVNKPHNCCERKRFYKITEKTQQKCLFKGETTWVAVNLKTHKPCRFPQEYIDAYNASL